MQISTSGAFGWLGWLPALAGSGSVGGLAGGPNRTNRPTKPHQLIRTGQSSTFIIFLLLFTKLGLCQNVIMVRFF